MRIKKGGRQEVRNLRLQARPRNHSAGANSSLYLAWPHLRDPRVMSPTCLDSVALISLNVASMQGSDPPLLPPLTMHGYIYSPVKRVGVMYTKQLTEGKTGRDNTAGIFCRLLGPWT